MSYAEAAAKGPKQTPEEARAPQPPQVEHTESESTSSLIDVDGPHISSVPSDFESQEIKTKTQAERLEHEAEDKARVAKEKASAKSSKGKKKAKSAIQSLNENRDNPVVIGNAVLIAAGATALGISAYKFKDALDWKTVGLWGGVVGAVGLGDYFVSSWLVTNKYPTK